MGKNIKKIAIILDSVFTSKAFLDSTYKYHYTVFMGFPDGSAVKNLPAMPETWVQSPGQEDPRKENVNPLQYSCLGNPMHRGAWWATVHWVARTGQDLLTQPPPPNSIYPSPCDLSHSV